MKVNFHSKSMKMKPIFRTIKIVCIVILFSVQMSTLTIKGIYSDGIFKKKNIIITVPFSSFSMQIKQNKWKYQATSE